MLGTTPDRWSVGCWCLALVDEVVVVVGVEETLYWSSSSRRTADGDDDGETEQDEVVGVEMDDS